jgi:hypothetical protein
MVSPSIRKRGFLITRRFESKSSSSSPERSGGLSSRASQSSCCVLDAAMRANPSSASALIATAASATCSEPCRKQARQEQRRAANRRHQQTKSGREAHRLRQRACRRRQCGPRVTDQGNRFGTRAGSERHSNLTRCRICGQPSEWIELHKRVRCHRRARRPRILLSARPKTRVF